MKAALAILGCMTMQGPLTQWVTDHRKHHALSDQPGRPALAARGHGDGIAGDVRGFVHAHVGWMFTNLGMEQGRQLRQGPLRRPARSGRSTASTCSGWCATLGIPFGIGYAFGGLAYGLEGLLWGGLVRIFLYQHATFSVNSICHMFGRRDYRRATSRATTGSSRCSSSARAGTTTTMPSRPRHATACAVSSSTSPGG